MIHNFPNGERGSSAESSPTDSPTLSPSRSRHKITALFHDKEYVSSSDTSSDLDYNGGMSKNAQKRQARKIQSESRSRQSLERKEESEEKIRQKLEEASKHETKEMKDRYGELPLIQSTERSGHGWIRFENITPDMLGQQIVFRARIHHTRRMGLKLVFFVFRQQITTIQGVLSEVPGEASILMLHWAEHLPRGSIVRIRGGLQRPEAPVKSTTIHELEVKITEMKVIVRREDPSKCMLSYGKRAPC